MLMWLGLFVFSAVCLWIAIDPEGFWELTTAWSYENPDAVRPSGAAFTISRIAAGIMAAAGFVALLSRLF